MGDATRGPGRPPIGPKVQAHIPVEPADWIAKEAERRGVDYAVVVRELIVSAWKVEVSA